MNPEYLFIINYSPENEESTFAASDLFGKYAPRTKRAVLMSTIGDASPKISMNNGPGPWAHKVGIYAVAEANATLKAKKGPESAKGICDFLNSQADSLGIGAPDLGKVVIVTCNGADRLKRGVLGVDSARIGSIKEEDVRVAKYQLGEVNWNKQIRDDINEVASAYGDENYANKDSVINESSNADLRLFAAELARNGAFPKIGAWDSGLFVRSDGKKSVKQTAYTLNGTERTNIKDGPVILPSRRMLSKVMFQLVKGENGLLTGMVLDERAWTDKPG